MSPNVWGPPTWIFLHVLAEKIKDEEFANVSSQLILFITQICYNLPCPECSEHAKRFWANVKTNNIKHKSDLINVLFVFHNIVNKRKNYRPFKYQDMQYYKTRKIIQCYNNFSKNFNTTGNMNLINESFHRKMLMGKLRTWVMTNIDKFDIN